MRSGRLALVCLVMISGGFVAMTEGCYDPLSDPTFFLQEHPTTGTGGSGGTGTTTVSQECIPNQTGTAIEDACGVFVSASEGSDSNGGNAKSQPVATLKKAIELAKGRPIYACADVAKAFSGAVTLDGDALIFGGLDCASWKYVAGTKTKWTAGADAVPLHVTANGSAVVADFVIEAANAAKEGESSIAIVAEANGYVDLSRCEVKAGDGMAGVTPEAPMGSGMVGMPGDPGLDGCVDLTTKPGGNGGALMCDSADVSGGLGGSGTSAVSGGSGSPGAPLAADTGKGGLGQGVAMSCDVDGNGGDGAEGFPGDPGAGATGNGSLSSTGFTGESGKDGATAGNPGQGGGGGGGAKKCANNNAGPSAGGGGSGGCGGAVGKGGGPGGGSIAIVSLGATLQFGDVTITTKAGGKGGDGGFGQPGGDGGLGGKPGGNNNDATSAACAGGPGGKGGAGGRGGGGRGGPSIGIAYTGEAPDLKSATITAGKAGDGGVGDGAMGMGATGVAAKTQSF